MVSSCCVKGCTEKFVKGGGISYFRISSKPEMQRNAWILALKRNGWTPKAHHRICSRHFVTGTWNSDPNHIDYIPTRCMSKDTNLWDANVNGDSLDASALDHSIAPDSPRDTDSPNMISFASYDADSSPKPALDEGATPGPQLANISPIRVPITGISSNQFNTNIPQSHRRKPRKQSRKTLHKWTSAPKLTSSHFCEHQDVHRNCCRVIRELAEENQILKSQVSCLLYELDRLRAETESTPSKRSDAPVEDFSEVNGKGSVLSDNMQDIELVSGSSPSLGFNDDIPFSTDGPEEDGQ